MVKQKKITTKSIITYFPYKNYNKKHKMFLSKLLKDNKTKNDSSV